ncbi:hypothetical protein BC332_33561 [Capsicum chinense]|nr:hypothetical protein BC332_33561 [Capsicum chinense]
MFQQQNLPFSFSRKNLETVGSPVAAVGATAEPPKKKRGRPRKIVGDGSTGITGATSSGNSSKKAQMTMARGPGAQNGNGHGSDTMSRMDLGPNSTSKTSSRAEDYPSPYKQTTSPLLKISAPEKNLETVGSPVAAVGATAEPPKKKRGRPRKIVGDGSTGITGATSSGNSSKKTLLGVVRMGDLQVFGGIKKLSNQNYNSWSKCMMPYLQGQDLGEVVNGNEVTSTKAEDTNGIVWKWRIKAGKETFSLKTTVEEDVL